MEKLNHTKGEWKINCLQVYQTNSDFINRKIIANIDPVNGKMSDENLANTKLIAAAPDLLKALNTLPPDTAFAHVTDVPLMIEKAANLIESKAVNEGNPDAHQHIIQALLLIAQNHRMVTKKATE